MSARLLLLIGSWLATGGRTTEVSSVLDLSYPNPLPMTDHCIDRRRFPEYIQIMVPESTGLSGIQIGGSEDGDCRQSPHCVTLSRPEFELLLNREVTGFMEMVKHPISACKTAQDYSEESRKASAQTRTLSEYAQDSRIGAVMKKTVGEWCGRIEKPWAGGRHVTEIRARFSEEGDMVVGRLIMTWQRTPDGPLGEHGYVSRIELIPWRHWELGVQLRGVRERHAGDYWYVFPAENGLQLEGDGKRLALTSNCAGFWKE